MTRICSLFLVCLLLVACATSPTGRRQLMLVSEQQAISASKTAYAQTLKPLSEEGKVDNDPVLKKRITAITERLVGQAVRMRPETARWEWSIKVIDEPETVNAWCMAGGKMAIYTGLIEKLHATDDEIAQVMGHEIAHALANHQAEKMSVALATTAGVAVVGAVSDPNWRPPGRRPRPRWRSRCRTAGPPKPRPTVSASSWPPRRATTRGPR
jgi:Zn-dependent protease with chaperone function